MREATYLGAVHGRAGNYGILFPDFHGCVSSGETVAAALRNGRDALQFHVDGMIEDGDAIPDPAEHSLVSVAATFTVPEDEDPDDWVGLMPITVMLADRRDFVGVDIPPTLARDLDEVTQDRSRFIIDATRRELARRKLADHKDAA